MKSTLFLQNVTQIDYAFLDNSGKLHGDSVSVSAEVAGEVEEYESVVVDFRKVEKSIKDIIDQSNYAHFDHTLWASAHMISRVKNSENVFIKGDGVEILCPSNAVTEFDSIEFKYLHIHNKVEYYLKKEYPYANIQLGLSFSRSQADDYQSKKFSFKYIHGLKNSSSFGCNNMNHGHHSWVNIISEIPVVLQKDIRDSINNAVFIWKDNVINETGDDITIAYEVPRGYFQTKYDKRVYNIKILDCETTVENLTEDRKSVV